MALIRRFLVLCAVSALLAGCGSTAQTFSQSRKPVRDPKQPEWVPKPSIADTDNAKAFRGISNRHAGLPQAYEEAEINAYVTAMNFVGLMVERAIGQATSQTGFSSDNRMGTAIRRNAIVKLKGSALLRGDFVEYHHDHFETQKEDWYEAYALFLIPRDVLKTAAVSTISTNVQGRTPEELESLRQAQKLLEEMSLDLDE